jgi:DNA-dependent protein kinase catalytic subunit
VETHLAEAQSRIPWDSLREVLLRVSGGPDSFITTRADFTATLAAVSAAGYIAGIGDRHLQNFLLDKRTGQLVAIDFGYCFGTAAQASNTPHVFFSFKTSLYFIFPQP